MDDSFSPLSQALANVFCIETLSVIVLAAAYGIFVGAIPGLTATMAVGLLVPMTFFLDPVPALAAIVTLEACAIFAGDIPTVLVRIPGTPSSAAYADDAYALTRAGRQREALGTALFFSVCGGLFGAAVLISAAPLLARVARQFTTFEDFWLYLLGLSCAVIVSRGSVTKGLLALFVGLLASTVGLGSDHSVPRFTFGQAELYPGIDFIPAMIGLFGLSEVLRNVMRPGEVIRGAATAPVPAATLASRLLRPWRDLFSLVLPRLWRRKIAFFRSASVGAFVGMLPGAGADIAAWLSFGLSRRFSRRGDEYGRGSVEGLADATSANSAALAGAWVPALVFGIPGDSVTAIVLGVLLMKNISPGPKIFTDPKQMVLLYGIYITFVVANLVLLPLGLVATRIGAAIVRAPRRVLLPVILLFCVVGSYALKGSYFDVWIMLVMGLLGFVLERHGVPLGPVVLGIVLGNALEHAFIQNLIKSDSPLDFFGFSRLAGMEERTLARPLSLLLGLVFVGAWAASGLLHIRGRRPRGA